MKHLCTCLISMAIYRLNKIFKKKSKYKVDFTFIFISIEKNKYFGNIQNF